MDLTQQINANRHQIEENRILKLLARHRAIPPEEYQPEEYNPFLNYVDPFNMVNMQALRNAYHQPI